MCGLMRSVVGTTEAMKSIQESIREVLPLPHSLEYQIAYTVIQSIYLLIAISNLICNSIINYLMFTKKELKENAGLQQIRVLSICDFFVALFGIGLSVYRLILMYGQSVMSRWSCNFTVTPLSVAMSASQIQCCIIATDRLFALHKPLKYRAHNHKKYAKFAALFHIGHSATLLAVTFLTLDYDELVNACSTPQMSEAYFAYLNVAFSAELVVMAVLCVTLIWSIRRYVRNKRKHSNLHNSVMRNMSVEQLRLSKAMERTMFAYILLYFIPNLLTILTPKFMSKNTAVIVLMIGGALFQINGLVNFIIYKRRLPYFRQALRHLFSKNATNFDYSPSSRRNQMIEIIDAGSHVVISCGQQRSMTPIEV